MPISLQTITSPLYLQEHLGNSLPIILDESTEHHHFDPSLSGISRKYEDLFDRSGGARFSLSMSEASKPQIHQTKVYDPTSSPQSEMYVAHTHGGIATSHMPHFEVPYTQPPEEPAYPTSASFHQRQTHSPAASYDHMRSRSIVPEVTGWTPQEGPQGTHLLVYLASNYELDDSWTFEVSIGDHQLSCVLTANAPKGVYFEYTLSTEIPAAPQGAWADFKVALSLHGRDSMGNDTGLVTLGDFTYTGLSHQSAQSSPAISRKRRLSDDGEVILARKRFSHNLRAASESAYDRQPFAMGHHYEQNEALLSLENAAAEMVHAYPRPAQSLILNQQHESPTQLHGPTSASSVGSVARPSPQTPSWNSAPPSSARSPVHAVAHARKATANGMSPIVSNPKLCRTTTLQQSPSPPAGPASVGQFNPYAMLPYNKAMLKINGDLEDMTKDWTKEEFEVQRRLVHFTRDQVGSTINTNFKPVAPEERQPSFICISCIWWESKKEHYITSVDTIYLLENLVGGRFTVEEKNRIRRNLEGFRPMTVSKGKSDSEDFFKLIMGFPAPKPRNIEKDVKVFPWKILSHALKKILGKYSASYSSMASALPSAGATTQDLVAGMIPPSSPHGSETPIAASYMSDVTGAVMHPGAVRPPVSYVDSAPAMVPAGPAGAYPMYHFTGAGVVPTSSPVSVMPGPPLQPHASYRHSSWDMPPAYVQSPPPGAQEHVLYKMDPPHHDAHFSLAQTSSSA